MSLRLFTSILIILCFSLGCSRQLSMNTVQTQTIVKSPILGFKKQLDCPIKILYSNTFQIEDDVVKTVLVARAKKPIDFKEYVVVCEETIKVDKNDSSVVKKIHEINKNNFSEIAFEVSPTSKLLFYVKSVTLNYNEMWKESI